jgi:hypothetical protein
MGQSKPFRSIAIVVEDDEIQREMIKLLLEESKFEIIQVRGCRDGIACHQDEASVAFDHRYQSDGRAGMTKTGATTPVFFWCVGVSFA